jgi:hypothetical protein
MMSSAAWGMSYLVALPSRTKFVAWRRAVGSPGTVACLASGQQGRCYTVAAL